MFVENPYKTEESFPEPPPSLPILEAELDSPINSNSKNSPNLNEQYDFSPVHKSLQVIQEKVGELQECIAALTANS